MSPPFTDGQRVGLGAVYLVPAADGGITLRTASKALALRGRDVSSVFGHLVELLDSTRTWSDVESSMREKIGSESDAILAQLADLGVIEAVPSEKLPPQLVSLNRYLKRNGGTAETGDKVAQATVLVAGEGAGLPALALSVASLGVSSIVLTARTPIQVTHTAQSAHLLKATPGESMVSRAAQVVAEADLDTEIVEHHDFPQSVTEWQRLLDSVTVAGITYDSPVISAPWLDEFNRAALQEGVPWTSAALLGRSRVHVGPSIIPGETACWTCFCQRFRSNVGVVGRYDEFEEFVSRIHEYIDRGSSPTFADFLGPLEAFEILRLIDHENLLPGSVNRVMTFDTWDYNMESHDVMRLPRCPDCSPVHDMPSERLWG